MLKGRRIMLLNLCVIDAQGLLKDVHEIGDLGCVPSSGHISSTYLQHVARIQVRNARKSVDSCPDMLCCSCASMCMPSQLLCAAGGMCPAILDVWALYEPSTAKKGNWVWPESVRFANMLYVHVICPSYSIGMHIGVLCSSQLLCIPVRIS